MPPRPHRHHRPYPLSTTRRALLVLAAIAFILAAVATPAHAATDYQVALCGYGSPDTAASIVDSQVTAPEALSSCYNVDPGSGAQPDGAYMGSVWQAPSDEPIVSILTAYDNFEANYGDGEDGWTSGLAVNITGGSGTYLSGIDNCTNATVACDQDLNGGATINGLDASNVGLLMTCHLADCPSSGRSLTYTDGLVVDLQDPDNAPTISASGSLLNAANGTWLSGSTANLSLNFSASDPSTVCSLTAELLNSNGTAVASSAVALDDPWGTSRLWNTATPCSGNAAGTLANLGNLPTGTYSLNVNAQSGANQENGAAGSWLAGNSWTNGEVLNIDNTPPTAALTSSGNASVWYGSPQTVTVNASDVGSGVDSVDCTGPDAPATPIPASQLPYTITVSQTGADTIACQPIDNAGNVGSIDSITVKIDNTVPTVALASDLNSSTWYSSTASIPAITVSSTSGPSGIASTTCQAPGVSDTLTTDSGTLDLSTLRDGTDTITCTPLTPAGIQGQSATLVVQLDSQTPTLSFAGQASQTKWYGTVAAIPELDTDATTGPSGLESIDCSGDGIANQTSFVNGANLALTGLQQGTGAITCTATSASGLTSAPQAFTLNLDGAAPSVAWQTSESQTTWYASAASVPALALNATAGGPSGIDHTTCSGDGFSAPVTIDGASGTLQPTGFNDGVNTISCVPYSGAGVSGAAISRTILVDSSQPPVTLSGTDSGTWYPDAQTITADASSDATPSGVQSISCSVDGGPAAITDAERAKQTVSGNGAHTATCQALSGAGVAGPAASTTVKIDAQTPTVTQTVIPAGASAPAGSVAVLVTADESNALSGIASTSCSLDQQAPTVVQGDKQTVAVTSAGLHTLVCSARTGAGVTSGGSTQTYDVASDPGQFSLQYGTVPTTWQSGAVTVPVQLTGATAQDYSSLTCTMGGGSPTTINGTSGSVNVTSSGSQQIACYATGNDGANTAALTQTVQIDQQTPTAAWSTSGTPTGEQVTLIGSEQTPLSGIASESCSVDGGTPQTSDTPHLTVPVDGNGTHQLDCTITTGAGVTAHVSHTVTVSVSVPAPLTVSAPDPTRWYHTAQSIVLDIPGGGPTVAAVRCTQHGVATSYPVTGTTVSVNVPAPGGDVRCLDVDNDSQQSTAVDFQVHIDTGAPTGYFTQTGPATAVASVSNPGASGIQSVTVQYQIGSAGWVTIPGAYDASSDKISVSLPAALHKPDVRYALQTVAVNNAGGQTVISTMEDGAPATGTSPADPDAGAAVRGGLYVGAVPPGRRIRVAKMVPQTRKVQITHGGKTVSRTERVYRTVPKRVTVHGRTTIRRLKVPRMRRIYVWKINTAVLAHTLTVRYGQTVSLAATLSLSSGQVDGQNATIIQQGAGIPRRLTATTNAAGTFHVTLGAGPSRSVAYTIDGVSHTAAIRVRGTAAVTVRGAATHRTLTLAAAGATGQVAYHLELDRGGRWGTVGTTRLTDRRGHATVHVPPALAHIPSTRIRVLIDPQPTWRYLAAKEDA